MCLDGDQERKDRSLRIKFWQPFGDIPVCVYTVYPVQTWTHSSWALKWAPGLWLCLYNSEPKLRKTPFCKRNVATQLPVGRSSPCLLGAWAEQVCVIWNMQYKHSLQSFRSVWLHCFLVRWVSTDILKLFTPVCEPEKKKQEFLQTEEQESWRNVKLPEMLLCFSNVFSFFVRFFSLMYNSTLF